MFVLALIRTRVHVCLCVCLRVLALVLFAFLVAVADLSPEEYHDQFLFHASGVFFTRPGGSISSYGDVGGAVIAATTTTDFYSTHAIFADFRDDEGSDLFDSAGVVSLRASVATTHCTGRHRRRHTLTQMYSCRQTDADTHTDTHTHTDTQPCCVA